MTHISLQRRSSTWLLSLFVLLALAVPGAPALAGEPPAVVPAVLAPTFNDLRISQVYGGGGNNGATYTNDFIELFNAGSATISLSGWSVQYASATGTSWQVTTLSGSIAPGKYYLVQEAQGTGGTTPLPTPDAIGIIAMSGTNGKVALVSSASALSGSCPTGGTVVDFVGFGSANCYEGSGATPALSNTTAAIRKAGGCTDSDNNAADFTVDPPTPRNSASPQHLCVADTTPPTVQSTNPITNAVAVALYTDVDVTFSEAVTNVVTSTFTLASASGSVTATVSGANADWTLNPNPLLAPNTVYTATLTTGITDLSSNALAQPYVWAFTTGGPDTTPPQVQSTVPANGAGIVPTNSTVQVIFNEPVQNVASGFSLAGPGGAVAGSVTGSGSNWTFTPSSALSLATTYTATLSSAILDLSGNALAPYTWSFVTRYSTTCYRLFELQGAGLASPLPDNTVVTTCPVKVTELAPHAYYVQDSPGDGRPETSDGMYVYLGSTTTPSVSAGQCVTVNGARISEYFEKTELSFPSSNPVTVGCDAAPAPVSITPLTSVPVTPSLTYERYEGMLVSMSITNAYVEGATKRFADGSAEIGFVASSVVPLLPNTPRVFEDDQAGTGPVMYISNLVTPTADLPDLKFGDTFTGTLSGVMDYNFGKYQIMTPTGNTIVSAAGTLPDDTEPPYLAGEFGICDFNVENLFSYVAGSPDDWRPTSEAEYQLWLTKRAKAIADKMQSCPIIGLEEVEGISKVWNDLAAKIQASGGVSYTTVFTRSADPRNISVGFLLDNSKVQLLGMSREQTCSTTNYGGGYSDPIYTCPAGQYIVHPRPPVSATVSISNQFTVTLLVNHFKSKSGDGGDAQRLAEATHLAGLVNGLLSQNPNAAVAVLGDLNDYEYSAPLMAMTTIAPGLTNLTWLLPKNDRYSYNFNGESEVLDHILVTQYLLDRLHAHSPLHIDADYPDPAVQDNTAIRASDHDPVVSRYYLCAWYDTNCSCNATSDVGDIQFTAGDWNKTSGFDPRNDVAGGAGPFPAPDGQVDILDVQAVAGQFNGATCQ